MVKIDIYTACDKCQRDNQKKQQDEIMDCIERGEDVYGNFEPCKLVPGYLKSAEVQLRLKSTLVDSQKHLEE